MRVMAMTKVAFLWLVTWSVCQAKPLSALVDWLEESGYDSLTGSSDDTEELGNAWEKSGQFEGDIILGSADSIRNGLINHQYHWPNKTLIYKIDRENFDDDQQDLIQRAIEEFHRRTCIHMRPRSEDERDYVLITGKGASGCSSHVGRQGGKQILYLKPNEPGKGCFRKGTVIHELLHALGFYHQQSAPERDEYIKILWENIEPGREHNFKKYETNAVSNFNVEYDYESIMHYSSYAFSKNEEKTILPLEEGARIGQRKTFSRKDIAKLHQMYECKMKNFQKPQGTAHTKQEKKWKENLKNTEKE